MAEPMTPPPVTTRSSSSNPLQMVIQRLQGECEMLRAEKREVERKLSQEQQKAARVLMEGNEMQRRCLVENQKLQSDVIHLKEKVREAHSSIEVLTERMARTEHNERQTHERCATLSDIIKDLEAEADRARRTIYHFEQEVERAKVAVAHATAERDDVLERTEADAKRVRQLWEETLSQHAAQLRSIQDQAAKAKREAAHHTKRGADKSATIKELQDKVAAATSTIAQDAHRYELLERDLKATKTELRHAQEQNTKLTESVQSIAMQLETHVGMLRATESRLHEAAEDAEVQRRLRREKETQLDDVLGELDALRSEFVTSLDAHETLVRELQQEMARRSSDQAQRIAALEAEQTYAASVSAMLGGHIGDYNKVLTSVNHKLADMQDRMEPPEIAKPPHTPRRPTEDTSMSIFAH
ncbi:hypothetical protein SPRG_10454 [Saprolegnia parasitica CBS 223.65]|uniref:Uncharacterized protein n=1 Tax=Saprolegnia parasitica (strain CBS 223.65) TaxID=695850 RepID=A0A067CCV7_SAPPC|nr:hypothetical protein SPRG_10454 [Saprolegnia parasitica CBS 223.65]KDO24376.1 hypothetical protein SPRG_10454 [Saprolegnia parasitica CBS 223.65]|eukprot:XP_012204969.1 hypothetical protein SPRG_10454 [Saprolegnia parasitica CBS 223.65]